MSSECQVGNTFASSSSSSEQVNYLARNQRQPNNPYSNTYNPGWRNHPNLAWGNQNQQNNQWNKRLVPNNQPRVNNQPGDPRVTKLEDMFGKFMQKTTGFMNETRTNFRNQGASIRNLEVQMGQLAEKLNERPQGSLPSNTVTNPHEQVGQFWKKLSKLERKILKRKLMKRSLLR